MIGFFILGPHGYPDPSHISNLSAELSAKGIEDDPTPEQQSDSEEESGGSSTTLASALVLGGTATAVAAAGVGAPLAASLALGSAVAMTAAAAVASGQMSQNQLQGQSYPQHQVGGPMKSKGRGKNRSGPYSRTR